MLNDELEVDLIFFKKKKNRIDQIRSQMTEPRAIRRLEVIHGR